jgi:hypothetical protein
MDGANGQTGGKNHSNPVVLTAFISFGLFNIFPASRTLRVICDCLSTFIVRFLTKQLRKSCPSSVYSISYEKDLNALCLANMQLLPLKGEQELSTYLLSGLPCTNGVWTVKLSPPKWTVMHLDLVRLKLWG